jgi:hypothetical protein
MNKRKADELSETSISTNQMDLTLDTGESTGDSAQSSKRPCLVDLRATSAGGAPSITFSYRRLSPSTGAVTHHTASVPDNCFLSVAVLKNAIAQESQIKMLPFPVVGGTSGSGFEQQLAVGHGEEAKYTSYTSFGASAPGDVKSSNMTETKRKLHTVARSMCNCGLVTEARARVPRSACIPPTAACVQKNKGQQCDLCRNALDSPCILCAPSGALGGATNMDTTADDDASAAACFLVTNGSSSPMTASGSGGCRHMFHAHCLEQSLKSRMKCPSCQAVWVHKPFLASSDTSAGAGASSMLLHDAMTTESQEATDFGAHAVPLIDGQGSSSPLSIPAHWTNSNQLYDAVTRDCKLQPGTFVLNVFSFKSSSNAYTEQVLLPSTDLPLPIVRSTSWSHVTICGPLAHAEGVNVELKVQVAAKSAFGMDTVKTIEVTASRTIGSIKATLQDATGIPREQQILKVVFPLGIPGVRSTDCAADGDRKDDLEQRLNRITIPLLDNSKSLAEESVWISSSAAGGNGPYLELSCSNSESVWLDLYTTQIHVSSTTAAADLRRLLVDLKQPLYVIERRYFGSHLPTSATFGAPTSAKCLDAFDTEDCQGFQQCFMLDMSWQPIQAEQSTTAMSSFLSTLYVVADMLNGQDARALAFLGALRIALGAGDFPPAIGTMKMLIDKHVKSVRAHDKAAFVNCLFACLRLFVPERTADRELFGYARVLFGYLLNKSTSVSAAFADSESFVDVSLTCALSNHRLVEPVFPLLTSAGDTDKAVQAYSRESLLRGSIEGKPRPLLDDLFRRSVPSQQGEIKSAPSTTKTALALGANVMWGFEEVYLGSSGSLETTELAYHGRTSALMNLVLNRFGPDVRHDVSLWSGLPTFDAAGSSRDDNATKLPITYFEINWQTVVSECAHEACLRIMDARVLRVAPRPSLTQIEDGSLVVFTGTGKDVESSTTVFLPVTGQERTIDCAKVFAKYGFVYLTCQHGRHLILVMCVCDSDCQGAHGQPAVARTWVRDRAGGR